MQSNYHKVLGQINRQPVKWLITGVAGFIGSNILEELLRNNQEVIGLDSFITGHRHNLDQVRSVIAKEQWDRFEFVEGDTLDEKLCLSLARRVEIILHQAALGSVPRSISNPLKTHQSNVDGFFNVLLSAKESGVKSLIYASSSSVYGDNTDLPKKEESIGQPLSPYAVTKRINELYAQNFSRVYKLSTTGLRYFNVFGPRQDLQSPYAAVIPLWIKALVGNSELYINGDGATSRDFTYVKNVVQANILAGVCGCENIEGAIYNVAVGEKVSLNTIFETLKEALFPYFKNIKEAKPIYRDFRAGDIRHSLADISLARKNLGYQPSHSFQLGVKEYIEYLRGSLQKNE